MNHKQTLIQHIQESLANGTFAKAILSKQADTTHMWKTLSLRPIQIRGELLVSCVFHEDTRDTTKNITTDELTALLDTLIETVFLEANVFSTQGDYHLKHARTGKSTLLKKKPTFTNPGTEKHNREKKTEIDPTEPFLQQLGITTADGEIKPSMYHKYRQMNSFLRIVHKLYTHSSLSKREKIIIHDFGSGKGYLTFAVAHTFGGNNYPQASVIGIEHKKDLVDTCNEIGLNRKVKNIYFHTSSIDSYEGKKANIVIALHACDTATDDALARAISTQAEIIIISPCCHAYVRDHMQLPSHHTALSKYGILIERQAELLTDVLRALTLEYYGYQTNVQEFVSSEHTDKNILITAVRKNNKPTQNVHVKEDILTIKQTYGISDYYLDRKLNLLI